MTIFGKRLSEYVAFCKPFLILILVVGIARVLLSLGDAHSSTARWLSMTVVIWIGLVYFAIRVHTSGFGGYQQLLPLCILQGVTVQMIVVPAIIVAILTGKDNVFSIPESFFGSDGKTWLHVGGHLFIGTTIGPLISWIVGCLIMFVAKKVTAGAKDAKAEARA